MVDIRYPAFYLVHWPSGPVYACEKHKDQLLAIARHLGTHVGFERIAPGHECPNCVNESKKEG